MIVEHGESIIVRQWKAMLRFVNDAFETTGTGKVKTRSLARALGLASSRSLELEQFTRKRTLFF